MPWRPLPRLVVAKTTDYPVVAADYGTVFTTRGATGTVIFTLPSTATIQAGFSVDFFNAADQTMTVTSATADTMSVFNDLTADSISFSTASEKIGGAIRVIWDGTGWLTFVSLGTETQTPTIAT